MSEETKEYKFPNGAIVIFYTPKSGINPYVSGLCNVWYQPTLDIDAVDARMVEINKP